MIDVFDAAIAAAIAGGKGGSGGTTDYADLTNKPQINGVTLSGDKSTDDLGIVEPWVGTAAEYTAAAATIPAGTPVIITDDTDMDTTPTQGSDNPVTSDGLYTALAAKEDKSDNVILPKSDFDALVTKTAKLYYVYPDPVVSGLQSLSPNVSQDLQQPMSLDVIDEPTAETEVLPDDSGEDR